jgi:hypothetical protein
MTTSLKTPSKRFTRIPGGAYKRITGTPGATRNGAGRDLLGMFSARADRRCDRGERIDGVLGRRAERERESTDHLRGMTRKYQSLVNRPQAQTLQPAALAVSYEPKLVPCHVGREQIRKRLDEIRAARKRQQ